MKKVLSKIIIILLPAVICFSQSVYQAEDAEEIYHGIVENEHSGFTGTGYVNLENEIGSYLEWIVSSIDSGNFTGTVYYATGADQDRKMNLIINSVVIEELSFPPTGAWTTWDTQTFNVSLDSGANVLRLISTTSNGSPNLDKLELSSAAGQDYFKLNLSVLGEGHIASEPSDSVFEQGSHVSLTAYPETGYSFIKWTGDTLSTSNPIVVRMDSSLALTAVFLEKGFPSPDTVLIGWASYGNGTTGGEGGTIVTVSNQSQLENYTGRSDKYIVQVQGTIEITPMGKEIAVGSNTTIIGLDTDATLKGGGLGVKNVSNVIIRNLTLKDAYVDWGGKTTDNDAIEINNSQYVWVDHCDLSHFDDGLIDIKNAADYVTISWCRFHNHNKVMLIGAGDDAIQDRTHLNTTVHHCWFDGSDGNHIGQRLPRVRFGKVHVFNNYYNDVIVSGVMSGFEGDIRLENCYFLNVIDPHSVVGDTSDNKLNASGNIFVNSGGRKDNEGTAFSPSDYYTYTLDNAADVPLIVASYAGIQLPTGINDENYGVSQDTWSFELLQNYPNPFNPETTIQYSLKKSGHVKIKIYNTVGELVETLIDENQVSGNYTITWNASHYASGIYYYQIECNNYKSVKKMVLIK